MGFAQFAQGTGLILITGIRIDTRQGRYHSGKMLKFSERAGSAYALRSGSGCSGTALSSTSFKSSLGLFRKVPRISDTKR